MRPLFLLLALVPAAFAAPLVPAARPTAPLLLRQGILHPVSGPEQTGADLLIVDGRIAALGRGLAAPAGAQVIELGGRHVYPGLIDANATVGLQELGSVVATIDSAETGEINPNARAQVAVNPDNTHIAVTRLNGVLTTLAVPRSTGGALIAGQSALVRLDGWTWEDMTLRATVGLHVYWPNLSAERRGRGAAAAGTGGPRRESERRLQAIREAFATARAYALAQPSAKDLRWEAMRPYVRGEAPVFVHADEAREIASVLDWARTQRPALKLVLVGGQESPRFAADLKELGIPVVLDGSYRLPLRRDDAQDAGYTVAAQLHAAGVRFCLSASEEGSHGNIRNLPYQAGLAAAHGLPPLEALKAVTQYPAEIVGAGAELGTLEPGKRATLIVTTGDPLEIPSRVELAFIDGVPIELRSRQTELDDKYGERIRRARAK